MLEQQTMSSSPRLLGNKRASGPTGEKADPIQTCLPPGRIRTLDGLSRRVLQTTTVVIQPLDAFRHPLEPQPPLAQIITTPLRYTGANLLGRYKCVDSHGSRSAVHHHHHHHHRRPSDASEPWSLLLQSCTSTSSQQTYRRSARKGKLKEGGERHLVDLSKLSAGSIQQASDGQSDAPHVAAWIRGVRQRAWRPNALRRHPLVQNSWPARHENEPLSSLDSAYQVSSNRKKHVHQLPKPVRNGPCPVFRPTAPPWVPRRAHSWVPPHRGCLG